jgi:hypothetical protein
MINEIDKLLLNSAQQAELEQIHQSYAQAAAFGDTAGMEQAHRRAEQLRASAGYSGGAAGDQYQLLRSASAPLGYAPYETLVNDALSGSVKAVAAGYTDQLAQLDLQRAALVAQNKENQAAARSAVWNTQRLAADGMLTRGLEHTGIADVITATALNQAVSNAYRALLEHQQDLQENDAARSTARAEALNEVAELRGDAAADLGDAYRHFYDLEVKELSKQENDYYYALALQQLKKQWAQEDKGRK